MTDMRIRVLGAAAGGGYPQWNCNHPNSRRARADTSMARTQSSIAVSIGGKRWFLFNASPDLRQQINDNDILQPAAASPLRYSPIQGVVLTNADVDHIAGLITLRESQPLTLYATQRVLGVLAANTVFNVLNPAFVQRQPFALEEVTMLRHTDGSDSGITVVPFVVPGKIALWLEDASQGDNFGSTDEDTIGLEVRDADGKVKFFYIPGCAEMTPELADRLRGAPLVFFDGTLWADDEMIRDQVGVKTGRRMGHMSLSGGKESTMAAFADLKVQRKIFIHINTTNPVLFAESVERRTAEENGWEVSCDGMDITI